MENKPKTIEFLETQDGEVKNYLFNSGSHLVAPFTLCLFRAATAHNIHPIVAFFSRKCKAALVPDQSEATLWACSIAARGKEPEKDAISRETDA